MWRQVDNFYKALQKSGNKFPFFRKASKAAKASASPGMSPLSPGNANQPAFSVDDMLIYSPVSPAILLRLLTLVATFETPNGTMYC